MNSLKLKITKTGRKYGFITWNKSNDDSVKLFFGKVKYVDIKVGNNIQRNKRIDWKKRRIGITYTLTRGLPKGANYFFLARNKKRDILLNFK